MQISVTIIGPGGEVSKRYPDGAVVAAVVNDRALMETIGVLMPAVAVIHGSTVTTSHELEDGDDVYVRSLKKPLLSTLTVPAPTPSAANRDAGAYAPGSPCTCTGGCPAASKAWAWAWASAIIALVHAAHQVVDKIIQHFGQ